MNLSIGFALGALAATQAFAGGKPVAVVELFTSQGCSSCPPANANLIRLREKPGVLPLSFSVTYWDRLGWKDIFGKQQFTERQYAYEPRLGESGPFTPQMVVNGRRSTVGFDLSQVEHIIDSTPLGEAPMIKLTDHNVTVQSSAGRSEKADVWLVRYEARVIDVPVARGENSGHTLPHANVVRDLIRLGAWAGSRVEFDLPATRDSLRTAILVQEPDAGPILAAVTD
jgi:hypothetical protein